MRILGTTAVQRRVHRGRGPFPSFITAKRLGASCWKAQPGGPPISSPCRVATKDRSRSGRIGFQPEARPVEAALRLKRARRARPGCTSRGPGLPRARPTLLPPRQHHLAATSRRQRHRSLQDRRPQQPQLTGLARPAGGSASRGGAMAAMKCMYRENDVVFSSGSRIEKNACYGLHGLPTGSLRTGSIALWRPSFGRHTDTKRSSGWDWSL